MEVIEKKYSSSDETEGNIKNIELDIEYEKKFFGKILA